MNEHIADAGGVEAPKSVPSEAQSADYDAGPACDLCGQTTCPDADLPEFSEPRGCILARVYEELRYDRCDYGCGRDITKATVRRAARALAERVLPPAEKGQADA